MLGSFDYIGVAAIITAIFSGIAAVFGALNHRNTTDVQQKLDTNGDPRTVGQQMSDVAAQVAPAPPATEPTPPTVP